LSLQQKQQASLPFRAQQTLTATNNCDESYQQQNKWNGDNSPNATKAADLNISEQIRNQASNMG